MARPGSSWTLSISNPQVRHFHLIGIVGGCPARRRAVIGEHIGASLGVRSGGVGREPGSFLDRYGAAREAIGDACRKHGDAAIVEDAHELAVRDATRTRILGMEP